MLLILLSVHRDTERTCCYDCMFMLGLSARGYWSQSGSWHCCSSSCTFTAWLCWHHLFCIFSTWLACKVGNRTSSLCFVNFGEFCLPSMLWHSWFSGMKGIRPVKTEWWDACMVICLGWGADLHVAQLMPLPLPVSCSSKSRLVLPFWYWLTRGVRDKIQRAIKWL